MTEKYTKEMTEKYTKDTDLKFLTLLLSTQISKLIYSKDKDYSEHYKKHPNKLMYLLSQFPAAYNYF